MDNVNQVVKEFRGIVVAEEFQSRGIENVVSFMNNADGSAADAAITLGAIFASEATDNIIAYRSGDHVHISGFADTSDTTVSAGDVINIVTLVLDSSAPVELRKLRPHPGLIQYVGGTKYIKQSPCVANSLICNGCGLMATTTGTVIAPGGATASFVFSIHATAANTFLIQATNTGATANPDAAGAMGLAFSFSYPAVPMSYILNDEFSA